MNGNRTLTLIKPKAVKEGNIGPILNKIQEGGFRIIAMKLTRLSFIEAQKFYAVHKERPFYENLCRFMSEGPIVAAILEKDNAVEAYRDFIGSTNPEEADEESIRGLYGTDLQQNAVHGSDSDDNARIEAGFFFAEREIFTA
ncbi:MAG: nucleoside-diphosphate kinase [Bacteroidales bacterium]|nr:nucleoside-diphosphate kinase [Bacteroidales bacterium]MCF8388200.1 nucleoside-diphosphate kinase [Bacteroidales bacterium]MCF8399023.1 nucleoside-diphosphate kinase [Bacteroidales bacterium]